MRFYHYTSEQDAIDDSNHLKPDAIEILYHVYVLIIYGFMV